MHFVCGKIQSQNQVIWKMRCISANSDFSKTDFASAAFLQACMERAESGDADHSADFGPVTVDVRRYGFIFRPGAEEEQVVAEWKLEAAWADRSVSLAYPDEFEASTLPLWSFERVKNEPDYVLQALQESADQVCLRLHQRMLAQAETE